MLKRVDTNAVFEICQYRNLSTVKWFVCGLYSSMLTYNLVWNNTERRYCLSIKIFWVYKLESERSGRGAHLFRPKAPGFPKLSF